MSNYAWISQKQCKHISEMYTYANFCVSTLLPILRLMVVADDRQFICQCNAYMSSHFYKAATPTEIIGMLGSYECKYKVGVALGGTKGVACWELIGYHTINSYHFSFQWCYVRHAFILTYPILNAPEAGLPPSVCTNLQEAIMNFRWQGGQWRSPYYFYHEISTYIGIPSLHETQIFCHYLTCMYIHTQALKLTCIRLDLWLHPTQVYMHKTSHVHSIVQCTRGWSVAWHSPSKREKLDDRPGFWWSTQCTEAAYVTVVLQTYECILNVLGEISQMLQLHNSFLEASVSLLFVVHLRNSVVCHEVRSSGPWTEEAERLIPLLELMNLGF